MTRNVMFYVMISELSSPINFFALNGVMLLLSPSGKLLDPVVSSTRVALVILRHLAAVFMWELTGRRLVGLAKQLGSQKFQLFHPTLLLTFDIVPSEVSLFLLTSLRVFNILTLQWHGNEAALRVEVAVLFVGTII